MANWTDEHERLIREALPTTPTTDLDRTWVTIQREVDANIPQVSRSRARVWIGVGVAAAVTSLSGVAVADVFTARTGEEPADAEALRLGGPGEVLDPAAPDFRQVVEEETSDIPFPSLAARAASIDDHVTDLSRGPEPARVTTGALRAWTAEHAVCSWSNLWVSARRAGNATAEAEAADMLISAQDWPAITDIDPVQENPTTTQEVLDTETGETSIHTFQDPTQFYYLQLVSEAVTEGDIRALGKALAEDAYCIGPSLVPEFPAALPPGFQGR